MILIQVFIVLKPGIVFTFLIHSGSLQKMLTALFNLQFPPLLELFIPEKPLPLLFCVSLILLC